MTPRAFCQSGTAEPVKLAVHGVMLAGATCCAAYNIAAMVFRTRNRTFEPHLLVNSVVYSALVILEVAHVRHHASHGD
jgi:hypothetical protein